MSHYFRINSCEPLRNEGRIYRQDGGVLRNPTKFFPGLELIQEKRMGGVIINNCALRNIEISPSYGEKNAVGSLSHCMLDKVSIIGNCEISNFDWGGRGYMAFKNAYISGWEDINILPSPEGKNYLIITYPDLESYKSKYEDEGWYQAYATSKRNISVRTWGTNLREEWYDLYCYTIEGLEWIALHGNPNNSSFERELYKHLKNEGYFYPS